MPAATRADVAAWTGCVARALARAEYERDVTAARRAGGEIDETHRVHEDAALAIVRARKPASRA